MEFAQQSVGCPSLGCTSHGQHNPAISRCHCKACDTWCSSAHDRRLVAFVLADCSNAESPGPSRPVARSAPDAWLSRDAERLGARQQQSQL